MKKPIENDEINEAFDNIFLAEENILQEGYTKGLEEGQQQGNTEAYHLGNINKTANVCFKVKGFNTFNFVRLSSGC